MEKNKRTPGSNTQDRRTLSRRDFLANAALIGAGLAVGPLLGTASSSEIDNRNGKGLHKGKNILKPRKLGKLEVSEIGFGCMSISANYGPPRTETKELR